MIENNFEKKENKSVIYTAEFVKDIQDLINRFPPKHQKVFGHHSTNAFKPANLDGVEVGKETIMKIIGRVFDEKGDALLVENLKATFKYPHITLSCAEGVPPFYSNEMIEKAVASGAVEYFSNPEEVSVVEGYSNGKDDITSL